MTDLSSDAGASPGASTGPGRLIRRAREQAGLSVEDLGAQIKLARGTLDALERDDFRTLTEPVYVRGYYRKLSKVLPVPEAELLAAYEAHVTPKSAPLPPSKLILSGDSDLGEGSSWSGRKIAGMVIAGMLIGALAFWFTSQRPAAPATVTPEAAPAASDLTNAEVSAEPPAAEPAPGLSPDPESAVVTPAPLSTTLTLAPSLSQPPATAGASAAAGVAPAPAPAPAPAAASEAPASGALPRAVGRAEVQLQFNSTSWTRIEDANGKSLLSGVIQAGDRQTLSGEAPFSIFLGNAPGVSIQFNGQPVDMAKYTKGNNTARFTLP